MVADALHSLGYPEVGATRVGKFISLELTGEDAETARARVDEMCRRLLCNGVIEEYRFESVSYTHLDVYKRQDLTVQADLPQLSSRGEE